MKIPVDASLPCRCVGVLSALMLGLLVVPAQAATFDLNLAGTVGNTYLFDSGQVGSVHFDEWWLQLDGFGPLTVSNGDVINATVTLDQSVTMSAYAGRTSFGLSLYGSNFPAGFTWTEGTTSFSNDGLLVASAGVSNNGGFGSIGTGVVLSQPDYVAITFDSVHSHFTITQLGAPANLDSAYMAYTLYSQAAPVPEPSSVLLIGSCVAGLLGMKRRKQ